MNVASDRAEEILGELRRIDGLDLQVCEPLSRHTRFAIGGPAQVFLTAGGLASFGTALEVVSRSGVPFAVVGGGTNLIVADEGFNGFVLRLAARDIQQTGNVLHAGAGVVLQLLVNHSIALGLAGLETMTGIPGWVGGAVYGNAGAYGRSIADSIRRVWAYDGQSRFALDRADCQFRYRDSVFKQRKDWVVLGCELELQSGDAAELSSRAAGILSVRNEKYPPQMRCAGSIFKNLLFPDLPPHVQSALPPGVVREGKVPSAWFLEQVGAKGMRVGDIQVATYHANLIYNDGEGSAADLVALIRRLKQMVGDRFGIAIEEEVQYIGDFSADV